MDAVLRGAAVYLFLLVMFRLNGERSLAQVTTFDFVLLLILAETTQQALLGDDFSVMNAFLLITTLLGLETLLSFLKQRWKTLDRLIDGVPLVVVEDGRLMPDRMSRARVDESDILHAARELQGLERLDQVKYAVLERSGGITIIPRQRAQ